MIYKLKPCPFCGDVAELITYQVESLVYTERLPKHVVECNNEDCIIYLLPEISYFPTKRQAILAWNKRTRKTKCTTVEV